MLVMMTVYLLNLHIFKSWPLPWLRSFYLLEMAVNFLRLCVY